MTFTEPRSDIHDLAAAVEKLVRAKGPQSLRDVFKRLPDYLHLTRGDLQRSTSRSCDLKWHTEVRNLSRNQNRHPTYKCYPPIPGIALEYEGTKVGSRGGRFILREPDEAGLVRKDAWTVRDLLNF